MQLGYRHIDTASFYGTESVIGEALAEAFRAGLVNRADMFITSKLWCDDHDPQDVIPALQRSLRLLQLRYLDLYLMHFPVKLKKGGNFPPAPDELLPVDIESTWHAIEKCMELRLTKAVGVSNFGVKKLSDMLKYAKIPPAVNQVEMHPIWQQPTLKTFCDARGIHVSAWSPLAAPGASYGTSEVISNPVIKRIAEKHGKTPAQIALRWGIQSGVSILPRSFNPNRLAENYSIFNWELIPEDLMEVQKLKQRRTNRCEFFCSAVHGPYKSLQDLWDGEI
ncbi:hypothetical protein O6H91_15G013000 [Diphasiastrum complanatum]|uniref:Uncharacterized protein n=1 Tax=Diphasiastrum complanatum TaxID=34168 RepID=A0ACC2BFW5_DIPCM|nr:hypothetical protein O6H91_15G013000 [Diphasiastrum complanatum]